MSRKLNKRFIGASGIAVLLTLFTLFGLNCSDDEKSTTGPDTPAEAALYVAVSSRGEFAAGTKADPLPSLSIAIRKSTWLGSPHRPIYMAAGTYQDTVVFLNGVSIHGGYDSLTWTRVDSLYSTILVGAHPAEADSITTKTVISGLEIVAPDATSPSSSSIAFRVQHCSDSLEFDSCRFVAGDGANGENGIDGAEGEDGGFGYNAYHNAGGWPGGGCYSGGAGGTKDGNNGTSNGWNGHGSCGGAGGAFQSHGSNATCDGADGVDGSGGTSQGQIVAGKWLPNAGVSATDGQPGSGGGGGGAYWNIIGYSLGGGGGGGGGCGGKGGTGGQGGGSSFAVFLIGSSPVFHDCEFVTGNGGRGGNGGDGRGCGYGAVGGAGALGDMWSGGHGGEGSAGGWGGAGQGGPGGSSVGIFQVGTCNPQMPNSTFALGDAGLGGWGGNNRSVGDFAPGAPGTADTVKQY